VQTSGPNVRHGTILSGIPLREEVLRIFVIRRTEIGFSPVSLEEQRRKVEPFYHEQRELVRQNENQQDSGPLLLENETRR